VLRKNNSYSYVIEKYTEIYLTIGTSAMPLYRILRYKNKA